MRRSTVDSCCERLASRLLCKTSHEAPQLVIVQICRSCPEAFHFLQATLLFFAFFVCFGLLAAATHATAKPLARVVSTVAKHPVVTAQSARAVVLLEVSIKLSLEHTFCDIHQLASEECDHQ